MGLFGVRLIAWNCCERFDRNYSHLSELDFDVAVITEAGPFEAGLAQTRELSWVMRLGVDRPHHTKHIAIVAQAPWRVEALVLPAEARHPWVVAALVHGPVEFTLLAFWALGREWVEGSLSYASQAQRVIDEVLPQLEGPVVFAGDFNAPIFSDAADSRRHAANVAALADLGLVSAYTSARPGADPLGEATLFHQWEEHQPFHIDHVFVPDAWASGMAVTIGTFEEWVATRRSDHVPIIVDIELWLRPPSVSAQDTASPVMRGGGHTASHQLLGLSDTEDRGSTGVRLRVGGRA